MADTNYRQAISKAFRSATNLLQVAISAGTSVIGRIRLVTASGDEITDDTADAIKALPVDGAGDDITDGDADALKTLSVDGAGEEIADIEANANKVLPVDTAGVAMVDETAYAERVMQVDPEGTTIARDEDDAHTSGQPGLPILGVRRDIPASMVDADGDYTLLQFDQIGRLRVNSGGADFSAMIGEPELRADCTGWAVWEKIARNANYVLGTEPNRQFRQGPWAAHLNGGAQNWASGYEDWASVWIPINEMHLTDLDEIMFTYYKFLAGTGDVGVAAPNIAIRVHDPDDHDQRAEITDTGAGVVTEGWHEVIFNETATAVLWYGNVTAGTPSLCPLEGTNYTWANFQADSIFSTWTVYQINIDYGYWGQTRSTGDVWIGSCQINNIPIKWEPTDLNDLGTRPNLTGSPFGEPTLVARNNGDAVWSRPGINPYFQKSGSGWLANLYGGVQSAWDDFAAIYIPVNELPIPLFGTARWTYYLSAAEAFGINMVIWVHDPFDFDRRAEITQEADIATLAKAQYWNAHELNQTTDQFYYYGENESNTSLITGEGPGNLYGWDDFQGDECFNTWTIYRISFEYGWHTGDNEFTDAWVADIVLNNEQIALKPDSGGSGRIGHRRYFSTDTSAASTLAPKTPFRLLSIDCEIDTAGTTDESLTITKDSGTADTYDTLLFTQNTKTPAIVSLFVPFGEGYDFLDSDELDMLWNNAQARDFGFTWTYQTVFG